MSADIQVRLATMMDAGDVTAVLEGSFPILTRRHYDPEVLRRSLPLICRANPTLLRSGRYFVAVDAAGTVVGCGGWSPETPGTGSCKPGIGHIRHFAVRADRTRLGIGRHLYDAARRQARAQEVEKFESYAGLNAVGFYGSLGFTAIGPINALLGDGIEFPGIRMECHL